METPVKKRIFIDYDKLSDAIIQEFGCIKTPIRTGISCIYNHGYYDPAYSVRKLEAAVTRRLGKLATKNVVSNAVDFIRRRTYINTDIYGIDNYICVENGHLNLDTFTLNKFHPSRVIFYKLPITFDANASMEPIKKLVSDWCKSDQIDKFQEHGGYPLSNDVLAKKIQYIVGPGNSGKSAWLRILGELLGKDNYSSLNLNEMTERFKSAQLFNKRANISSDIPYRIPLNNYSLLKNLTGGDEITIEFKGIDPFKYLSKAKLFFSGNGLPLINTKQADEAFFGRWDFFDFDHVFTEKRDIIGEYTTPEMKSAWLNWMIEGYQRLKTNKWKFTNGDDAESSQIRFYTLPVATPHIFDIWLKQNYIPQVEGWIEKTELWKECTEWHLSKNIIEFGYITEKSIFGKWMLDNRTIPVKSYQPTVKGNQIEAYKGIARIPREITGVTEVK